MDLDGIPKQRWREGLIASWRHVTGLDSIPKGQSFFTLGGPAQAPNSELNQLVRRGFITSDQYVSAERNAAIHKLNCKIQGPTWMHGEFDECLLDFVADTKIAFVNADLMTGITLALPMIRRVLDIIGEWNEAPRMVLSFNIIESNRRAENFGYKYAPVLATVKADSAMQRHMRWLDLIDVNTYANKTVGQGSGISKFTTLTYTNK